jgi:RecT family
MTDIPTDPEGLARAFGLGIFALYGHTPKTAPPPLLGWVKAWRANAEAILTATPALCKAAPAALGAAVINLAKMGLMPGIPGDASATGYLYPGQGGPMGVPSARGRIALARAAGVAVETYPVGVKDAITLDVDGDVAEVRPNPDERPTKWEHLRGVIVRTEDGTGAVRRHWISAGEIEVRKARSKGGGPWQSDPVGMARGKAVKILVDRGILPQAPIPIPGLRDWYATAAPTLPAIDAPAARALPAPAEPEPADAPPAAPTAPETAPAAPDVSAPAEAEPAATEAPATAGEGTPSALLESDAMLALIGDVTAAAFDDRVIGDADAKRSALEAIDAWLIALAKAGRAPTIEAARAAMPRLIARARDLAGNPPAREA